MNKQIDEKSGMTSADDAKVIVRVLRDCGIIRINRDKLQCERKMIELGLMLPDGKSGCLIYGREGNAALYLFVCLPNSNSERSASGAGLSNYGFRFDSGKYRSNPVKGLGGVGEAFLAFMGAVATLEGFDLARCTLERERPGRN
jgi:hypothetical protein